MSHARGNAARRTAGSCWPAASRTAAGRKVDLQAFTARLPRGYRYDDSLAQEIVFASSHDLDQRQRLIDSVLATVHLG